MNKGYNGQGIERIGIKKEIGPILVIRIILFIRNINILYIWVTAMV